MPVFVQVQKIEKTAKPHSGTFRTGRLTGQLTEVALGYQSLLAEDPGNPEALVGMSLVALASGQMDAAIKMASAAVAVAPEMGSAWVALGQTLRATGRSAEAEKAYEGAIELDGMDALARLGLGEMRIASGIAEEAALDEADDVAAAFGDIGIYVDLAAEGRGGGSFRQPARRCSRAGRIEPGPGPGGDCRAGGNA